MVYSTKMRVLSEAQLLLVMGTLLLGVSCGEHPESTYQSIAAAQASGAIERGWIPASLPASTARIREKHDIDTNEAWGMFEFHPDDRPASDTLVLASGPALSELKIRSADVEWWPTALTGALSQQKLENFEFYVVETPHRFWVALDRKQRRGFFWNASAIE